jgi:hypothetical protein
MKRNGVHTMGSHNEVMGSPEEIKEFFSNAGSSENLKTNATLI